MSCSSAMYRPGCCGRDYTSACTSTGALSDVTIVEAGRRRGKMRGKGQAVSRCYMSTSVMRNCDTGLPLLKGGIFTSVDGKMVPRNHNQPAAIWPPLMGDLEKYFEPPAQLHMRTALKVSRQLLIRTGHVPSLGTLPT